MKQVDQISANINESEISEKRYVWLDWMKVLGIYFIIWGHLFPPFHQFIYVFNVPIFFIISGFLAKKETSNKIFWNKIIFNLFIPMFLMSIINHIFKFRNAIFIGEYNFDYTIQFIQDFAIGKHYVLGACWYIYILILIKIIFQYSSSHKIVIILTGCIAPFISIVIDNEFNTLPIFNKAIIFQTLFLAYPLFIIGIEGKKIIINEVKKGIMRHYIYIILGLFGIFLCGKYNETVWMYRHEYGNNILLFYIGSLMGFIAIYSISVILSRTITFKSLKLLSNSSILIMGLHWNILFLLKKIPLHNYYIEQLYPIICMLTFIPLWGICKKYFPLIIGTYRIKK